MKGVYPINQRTGVYKIINPDNEVYIGGTRSFVDRLAKYRNVKTNTQPLLHNSIKRHGWGSHVFSVVHDLPKDVSQEVLDRYEQLYMDLHKDCGVTLLNLKGAGRGGKHGEKTIEKYKNGGRVGEKNALFGRKLTDEHKKKLCKPRPSLKGRIFSDETKAKMSASRFGMKMSDESKKKMSEGRTGGKNINARKVVDTATGQIFDFVGDAAIASGYSRSYLSAMLCGLIKNNSTFKYL